MIKSFGLPFNETDTQATQIMMNKIINSTDYSSILKVRFNLGGEDYTIETFYSHDNDINHITQKTINNAIQNTTKEERKKLRDIDIDPSLIQVNKEILIRNFLMHNLAINSVDNAYYQKAIKTYFQNQRLDNFFTLTILLPKKSLAEGLNAGLNDGMDYQHLVFTHNIDFFVSDDKFYKRIPNNINEYLDFSFISFSNFYSKVNRKSNNTLERNK